MVATLASRSDYPFVSTRPSRTSSLLKGDILLETQPHTAWGAAVTAQVYLPLEKTAVWKRLTDYPLWVQYFPDISHSEVLSGHSAESKRIRQAASKTFLFLTVEVEIFLKVVETSFHRVQFQFESGNFRDFSADLRLEEFTKGTLLTYTVQATPTIPVPSLIIQQAIQLDLPANLRHLRQELCR